MGKITDYWLKSMKIKVFAPHRPENQKMIESSEFHEFWKNHPEFEQYYQELRPICQKFDEKIMKPSFDIAARHFRVTLE